MATKRAADGVFKMSRIEIVEMQVRWAKDDVRDAKQSLAAARFTLAACVKELKALKREARDAG